MTPIEQMQAVASRNWTDYQKFIDFMKKENETRQVNIVRAYVGMQRDLAGKFKEPGWSIDKNSFTYVQDNGELKLGVKLTRATTWEVDWEAYDRQYHPDYAENSYGWPPKRHHGREDAPEHFRKYKYIHETILIDSKFIKDNKL